MVPVRLAVGGRMLQEVGETLGAFGSIAGCAGRDRPGDLCQLALDRWAETT